MNYLKGGWDLKGDKDLSSTYVITGVGTESNMMLKGITFAVRRLKSLNDSCCVTLENAFVFAAKQCMATVIKISKLCLPNAG